MSSHKNGCALSIAIAIRETKPQNETKTNFIEYNFIFGLIIKCIITHYAERSKLHISQLLSDESGSLVVFSGNRIRQVVNFKPHERQILFPFH